MSSPLSSPTFRRLFAAQICSLIGVGLLTVALSLAAFRIGGAVAGGQILGLLLALKMVAYVMLAPLAETLLSGVSRKRAMVSLDMGRLLLLLPMAFVTQPWQVATLAFAFFVLAAGFTPLFQSVIPDILPQEAAYTKALAWSRVAYTTEAVMSPVIAAVMLKIVAGEALFYAAALAFAGSVLALLLTRFPTGTQAPRKGPFLKRVGHGFWIYCHTPRLRGLFLLNLSLSLSMAWVLVNSVVYAGTRLGDSEHYFPILMACYGAGAALGAVTVPRLLTRISERRAMILGALGFAGVGVAFSLLPAPQMPFLGAVWVAFGVASSLVLTPGGLVITKSAAQKDRASVFAAQFSASHAGWLIAYPLAGWLGSLLSLETALLYLSLISIVLTLIALRVWPVDDPLDLAHSHPELPDDHPHLQQVPAYGAQHRHIHAFRIDELHPIWTEQSV
ncbi:MFS transporter [Roseobacter sp. OBYS 0001]|uniref:MFS transporter n=1 Tax=Roseobacter sp. OBYS 0001 TaxID=882651 RepID=UPI001C82142F|nr:MFS transporter [Roseobacter sp. OBYS 0001]